VRQKSKYLVLQGTNELYVTCTVVPLFSKYEYSEGYDVKFHRKFHPMKSRYLATYLILVLDPTYVVFLRGTLISFPVPLPCSFEVTIFAS
jgi:hypothetical protein